MNLRKSGWGGEVERIHLAQHVDRWRAVVNKVMNLRVLAPQSWFFICRTLTLQVISLCFSMQMRL
jgi:hypothetical protein